MTIDIDGIFMRNDYTYDEEYFKNIFLQLQKNGCHFAVASGNQYYQLRDLFPDCHEDIAFVKDKKEILFTANMPKTTVNKVIDVCRKYPDIKNVMCGKRDI